MGGCLRLFDIYRYEIKIIFCQLKKTFFKKNLSMASEEEECETKAAEELGITVSEMRSLFDPSSPSHTNEPVFVEVHYAPPHPHPLCFDKTPKFELPPEGPARTNLIKALRAVHCVKPRKI